MGLASENDAHLSLEENNDIEETLAHLRIFFKQFRLSTLSRFFHKGFSIKAPDQIEEADYWPHPQPQSAIDVEILGQTRDPHSPEFINLKFTLQCTLSLNADRSWYYTLHTEGIFVSDAVPKSTRRTGVYSFFSGHQFSIEAILNSNEFRNFLDSLFMFNLEPIQEGPPPVISYLNELFRQYSLSALIRKIYTEREKTNLAN